MSEALRQLLATKSEDLATNINDSELEWMVTQGICFTGALEAVTLEVLMGPGGLRLGLAYALKAVFNTGECRGLPAGLPACRPAGLLACLLHTAPLRCGACT